MPRAGTKSDFSSRKKTGFAKTRKPTPKINYNARQRPSTFVKKKCKRYENKNCNSRIAKIE